MFETEIPVGTSDGETTFVAHPEEGERHFESTLELWRRNLFAQPIGVR